MKLINLQQLLQAPAGTIFMEYTPHTNGPLLIKGSSKFPEDSIVDCELVGVGGICTDHVQDKDHDICGLQMELMTKGSFHMDPELFGRSSYEEDEKFIIYEESDIDHLIDCLIKAKIGLKHGNLDEIWKDFACHKTEATKTANEEIRNDYQKLD